MKSGEKFARVFQAVAAHVEAYEQRERSRVEKNYGIAMRKSAAILAEFIEGASFTELVQIEKMFQENDLAVYAKRPATMKSVLEGIEDLEAGERVCRQLMENADAYKAHEYRKKERIAPERIIPLDAMRRALRGQAKRVENYRSNVMGNLQEQEFMSARIAMLRRAEKLYDAMQRLRLLPPDPDV